MTPPNAPPVRPAGPAAAAVALPGAVPWVVWALVAAATSVVVGVMWDISWHRSIGRDTFWTPAHMAIYLGGALAGLSCGWVVLKTTFAGTPEARAASVRVWGFYGPLGAWVAIWGAIAMLTSAPFDNWWHNAYGLDVKVLSPPHVLLALGFTGVQLGAVALVLALQNRAAESARRVYGLLLGVTAGILLENSAIMGIEQIGFANLAHSGLYYKVAGAAFPIVLVAVARASRLRWAATTAATAYFLLSLVMIWVLEQFPATPQLAPVFNPLTHMVPPTFPLLLIVPSVAVDILVHRFGSWNGWLLSLVTGIAFLALFFVTQWYAAEFLLSPAARNAVFGVDNWDYSSTLGPWRYQFWRLRDDAVTAPGLAWAALFAALSSRVGLWLGTWTARLRR